MMSINHYKGVFKLDIPSYFNPRSQIGSDFINFKDIKIYLVIFLEFLTDL